MPSFWWKNITK